MKCISVSGSAQAQETEYTFLMILDTSINLDFHSQDPNVWTMHDSSYSSKFGPLQEAGNLPTSSLVLLPATSAGSSSSMGATPLELMCKFADVAMGDALAGWCGAEADAGCTTAGAGG